MQQRREQKPNSLHISSLLEVGIRLLAFAAPVTEQHQVTSWTFQRKEGRMLNFQTKEQCENFQMMNFGISCATCERSDEECPWHRQDNEPEIQLEELTAQVA